MRSMRGVSGFVLLASCAFAGTVILDTGVNPGWMVTTPASVGMGTFAAVPIGQTPNNTWVTATDNSQWISYLSNAGSLIVPPCCNDISYLYILTFIPGEGTGTFTFKYSGDNTSSIQFYQNNVAIGPAFAGAGNDLNQSFKNVSTGTLTITAGPTDVFKIIATVTNYPNGPGGNPTGFFLDGTVITPEPATFGLLGFGAAALAASRLRRK
jgi:PEP-CTERM motif